MPKVTDRTLLHMLTLAGQQFVVCSANGEIIDCSLIVARSLGVSISGLIGQKFYNFAQLESGNLSALCKVISDNCSREEILQISAPQSEPIFYNCKIVKSNGVLGFFLIDIHDAYLAKLNQAKEAQREKLLSLVANNTNSAVSILSTSGEILWVNNSFEKITGFTPPEAIGTNIASLLSGRAGRLQNWDHINNATLQRQSISKECHHIRKNGTAFWTRDDVFVSLNEQSKVANLVVVQSDITSMVEQAEKQRLLESEKKRAEELAQTKTRFMASISHEIRTPLNAILGASELLSDSGLTADQEEYSRLIRMSGKALLSIVDDVLFYSRSEEQGIELNEAHFSIIECIEHVFTVVDSLAREKQLPLIFDIDPKCPLIFIGDEDRFKQVLLNLVTNAIKFTDKGWVLITCRLEKQLIVEVKDSGSGIENQQIETLFKPFVQGDNSIRRRVGGSGLGLAICQQIVNAMRGSITVQSVLSKGSCFRLSLPFKRHADAVLNEKVETKTYVVCSNVKPVTNALANLIRRLGHKVEVKKVSELKESALFHNTVFIFHDMDNEGLSIAERLPKDNLVLGINSYSEPAVEQCLSENIRFIRGAIAPYLLGRAHLKFEEDLYDLGFGPFSENQQYRELQTPLRDYGGAAVLLVEDNVNNQFVASQFLDKYNCKVTIAENGVEALEHIERSAFELVLMDIHMPIMDGIEATRIIRSKPKYATLPIIALTANALEGDRELFLRVGMNDYLSKPIKSKLLMSMLDTFLSSNKKERRKSEDIANANSWISNLLNG